MKKTEIIILSGFLGSGKTSLLKECLQNEIQNNRKIAVIMNEIGKISIDSNEVPEDIRLKELLNGCICCTMKDQLEIQLLSLVQNNELDVIYIETTGVANPIDIIDACTTAQTVERLILKGIITTVDATRWLTKSNLSPTVRYLLIQQITYCDLVLINRLDKLEVNQGELVLNEINTLNPNYLEYKGFNNNLFSNLSFTNKINPGDHLDAYTSLKIKTFLYHQKNSFSKESFEQFLKNVPSSLFRLKGYLSFKNDPTLYNVQYSNGLVSYEKEFMKLPKRIVLIGEDLDTNYFEQELNKID